MTHDVEGLDKASLELLINAGKPTYKIAALNSPFETKDLLNQENIVGTQKIDTGGKIYY